MFEWNNCWVNHTYDVGDLCKNLFFDEERRMKPRLIGPNKKIQVLFGGPWGPRIGILSNRVNYLYKTTVEKTMTL